MQVSIFALAMKIVFLVIGKTSERWMKEGVEVYLNRLQHYQDTSLIAPPDVKGGGKMRPDILKAKAKSFQKFIVSSDLVVLLDEKGH